MTNLVGNLAFVDPPSTNQVIEGWLDYASGAKKCHRRQFARYPFFRSVKVTVGISHEMEISAFSRDISLKGIGLLHSVNLPFQEVSLAIETMGGRFVSCQANVVWTKPCGNGWFLSGLRAVGLSTIKTFTLLVEVFASELKERWHQRYPFVFPATITLGDQPRTTIPALTGDISLGGIRLIHHTNINAKNASLRIETITGSGYDIPLDFVWSKTCGSGVFVSGWRFWKPDITELESYSP